MQLQIQPEWLDLVLEFPFFFFFFGLMYNPNDAIFELYNPSDAIFELICSFDMEFLSLQLGEESTCYLPRRK